MAAAALANVDTAVVSLSGDGSCAAEAAMLAAAEDAVSEVDSLPRCHTESTPCSQHKRNPMQPSKAAAACSDKLDSHHQRMYAKRLIMGLYLKLNNLPK